MKDREVDNIARMDTDLPKSSNKLGILIVGPLPPAVGGIATFIQGMSQSYLGRKYRVALFGTERPTHRIARDVRHPVFIFRIGVRPLLEAVLRTVSHLIIFPFVLIKSNPDIVHIHTASYWPFWENATYGLLSKILHKKVILHIHGGLFLKFYEESNVFVKFQIRKILDIPNKIVVLSRRWKKLLEGIAREEKMAVIENFVDLEQFTSYRKKFDLRKDTINVLFVGGVAAKAKGVHVILKAIPIVAVKCKDVVFSMVACEEVHESGVVENKNLYSSNAVFLDYVFDEEKTNVFVSADIFVLPSYAEGFPVTLLEAMAAGLPVIVTPVGAMPEVVEEGKNGFLIRVGDYRALAERILLLAKDRRLRCKMASNNIKKIRERYDRTVVMRKLDHLYTQIISDQDT